MPEKKGDSKCPVTSFLLYLQHLHPDCDALWARPKTTPVSLTDVWYYNRPVGQCVLARFMRDLSAKHQLSQVYTNHSIRVAGASILTKKAFAPSQIKDVIGHR
jgi:hypothetical protein